MAAESLGHEIVVAHVGADRAAEAIAIDASFPSSSIPLSAIASAAVIRVSGIFLSWPGKSVSTSTVAPSSRRSGIPATPVSRRMPLLARLHRPPDRFSIAANGRHDADAGNHDPIVAQAAQTHDMHTREEEFWVESANSSATVDAVVAASAEGHLANASPMA